MLWDVKIEKKNQIIDDFLVKHEDDKLPCRLLRYTTMCVVFSNIRKTVIVSDLIDKSFSHGL